MRWVIALLLFAPQLTTAAGPAYRVLAADKGKVSLVDAAGKVLWSMENKAEVHDIQMLANGNILVPTSRTTVAEVAPDKSITWSYTAKPKSGYTGAIEIHACQRLANGDTMIAESGNQRIVEVNKSGTIVREVPLTVDHPNAHRDTRMVRKTAANTYLVCHEGDGKVRDERRKPIEEIACRGGHGRVTPSVIRA